MASLSEYVEKELRQAWKLSVIEVEKVADQNDFGHYRCVIEESDSLIIIKQDIYVSGGLPLNRLKEYEEFRKKWFEHVEKVKEIIQPKRHSQELIENKKIKLRKRKKKNRNLSKPHKISTK